MSSYFYIFACFTSCLISINDAARILAVFPTPSISHQVVFRPLTQELVKRGHQVIVITPDPVFPKGQAPANLTEIDVHDISYTTWRSQVFSASTTSGKKDDLLTQMEVFLPLLSLVFEQQILTDDVQNMINDQSNKFDLLLIEACVRPALVYSHIFKAPVILVSSFGSISGMFDLMGAPTHPVLYPSVVRQRLYNLTMWEKIAELYNHYAIENIFAKHEKSSNEIIKKMLGPDTPTIKDLEGNVHMVFLNVHPLWEENRPMPPSVLFMGGIHQKPQKELPKDLKSYLDSSKNGVIYISFGTNVQPSLLPPERIQILVNVFSQMRYDVLWKWDKDELPGRSENIKIAKWLPQSDLLRHPKVKAFITQGGLQSTDEAITAGVPLIGMPMLGDQWYNVEHYVHHKIGLRLDMETLTEDTFKNAIDTVIRDESYRRNVARLRSLMHDQPQRPLERAVWWTEHVLRHGGAKHLRAPGANVSWAEYLELELVAIMLTSLLVIFLVISVVLYYSWRYVSTRFVTTIKFKNS